MRTTVKFLHFYVGQNILNQRGEVTQLHGISATSALYSMDKQGDWWNFDEYPIKPILRQLSTMTPEEFNIIFDTTTNPNIANDRIREMSQSFYELSKFLCLWGNYDSTPRLCDAGFDIFNLIKDGLAVDAATIQSDAEQAQKIQSNE